MLNFQGNYYTNLQKQYIEEGVSFNKVIEIYSSVTKSEKEFYEAVLKDPTAKNTYNYSEKNGLFECVLGLRSKLEKLIKHPEKFLNPRIEDIIQDECNRTHVDLSTDEERSKIVDIALNNVIKYKEIKKIKDKKEIEQEKEKIEQKIKNKKNGQATNIVAVNKEVGTIKFDSSKLENCGSRFRKLEFFQRKDSEDSSLTINTKTLESDDLKPQENIISKDSKPKEDIDPENSKVKINIENIQEKPAPKEKVPEISAEIQAFRAFLDEENFKKNSSIYEFEYRDEDDEEWENLYEKIQKQHLGLEHSSNELQKKDDSPRWVIKSEECISYEKCTPIEPKIQVNSKPLHRINILPRERQKIKISKKVDLPKSKTREELGEITNFEKVESCFDYEKGILKQSYFGRFLKFNHEVLRLSLDQILNIDRKRIEEYKPWVNFYTLDFCCQMSELLKDKIYRKFPGSDLSFKKWKKWFNGSEEDLLQILDSVVIRKYRDLILEEYDELIKKILKGVLTQWIEDSSINKNYILDSILLLIYEYRLTEEIEAKEAQEEKETKEAMERKANIVSIQVNTVSIQVNTPHVIATIQDLKMQMESNINGINIYPILIRTNHTNSIVEFMNEKFIKSESKDDNIFSGQLFKLFEQWNSSKGYAYISSSTFGIKLKEYKLPSKRISSGLLYTYIRLKQIF